MQGHRSVPAVQNPIEADFEAEISRKDNSHSRPVGPVAAIAREYAIDSQRLLGLLLKLDYSEMHIATCDPWKRKCGGVPRNSFVLVKASPAHLSREDRHFSDRVILARVTDSVPTPVAGDALNTLFEVHKAQAVMDPYTMKELQWSAMRASIVGTFYDGAAGAISFGNDVDTFFGAHAYEVYSPSPDHLEVLINSFVTCEQPLEIGRLRYTETPSLAGEMHVPIKVDPRDFVGVSYGQRTALFGKTRFGKSNTIKVIADTILRSDPHPGQIIFDPSGEYTYWNEQDEGSLFLLHATQSQRFSISPKSVPQEQLLKLAPPRLLKLNFYEAVSVSHQLIVSLWDEINQGNRPGYMVPLLEWAPTDPQDAPPASQKSAYNHYWRTMSLWFGVLKMAGFAEPTGLKVPVDFPGPVKQQLTSDPNVRYERDSSGNFATKQPVGNLTSIYAAIARLWEQSGGQVFPTSSGDPYFNDVEAKLLSILKGDPTRTGHNYIRPFGTKFHDPAGSSIFFEISKLARSGKTVFVEMAQGNEQVRKVLSERICQQVLRDMINEFSNGTLGNNFVVLYFEEAHTLFRADDKGLNSIYNKVAKEGAKFHLSMVYATQSMTTLSPDLLKNTENFFIAHLDDDREVREVTRKYVFRDIAEDVQRTQSKGYVRMITASHRFALPVQIRKFSPV